MKYSSTATVAAEALHSIGIDGNGFNSFWGFREGKVTKQYNDGGDHRHEASSLATRLLGPEDGHIKIQSCCARVCMTRARHDTILVLLPIRTLFLQRGNKCRRKVLTKNAAITRAVNRLCSPICRRRYPIHRRIRRVNESLF